jgi:hypothetical protein
MRSANRHLCPNNNRARLTDSRLIAISRLILQHSCARANASPPPRVIVGRDFARGRARFSRKWHRFVPAHAARACMCSRGARLFRGVRSGARCLLSPSHLAGIRDSARQMTPPRANQARTRDARVLLVRANQDARILTKWRAQLRAGIRTTASLPMFPVDAARLSGQLFSEVRAAERPCAKYQQ